MLRFKVGEKVRVVGNISGHRFNIGKIVTIDTLCLDAKSPHYYAVCGGGSKFVEGWFVKDEELEAIVEEKSVKEFKLEVGHIVVEGSGDIGVVFQADEAGVRIGYTGNGTNGSWATFSSNDPAGILKSESNKNEWAIVEVYKYRKWGIEDIYQHTLLWKYDDTETVRKEKEAERNKEVDRQKEELSNIIRTAQNTIRLAQEQLENL